MEHILWVYGQAYDPKRPVVCRDERPCFLIGDRIEAIAMQSGQVRKEHYAYEKNGSCSLFAAIEPLTGKRVAQVHRQRTKREFTLFCQAVAAAYPAAAVIPVILDNLNTHNASAFYQHLPADKAFALAQRFEFIYTPKAASWLNMIEIEFSALARLCLKRRIPTLEQLEKEVLALITDRDQKRLTINWQFTIDQSRNKLNRHYSLVHDANAASKLV
jgi:hypothetical protein